MNNLMTESFERVAGRYPGERDNESVHHPSDPRMGGFFKQIGDIDIQIEKITSYYNKLQATNEQSQLKTKASEMKAIKKQMEKDVDDVKKIAHKIKVMLDQLDKDNLMNRQKPDCEKGTAIDRSRMGMTVYGSEKEVKREGVTIPVTGTKPTEEMIDQLIETGNSEQIFEKAVQSGGRGQVVDTLAEIQERHDTVLELERKLIDLQQMFLDMAVLVDAQGDMLDDIEAQVTKSVDHIENATVTLQEAKKLQKNSRKYMCIAIIILVIFMLTALGAIMKGASKSA